MELTLIEKTNFETKEISIYGENGKPERWYTREEIGRALGYKFPADSVRRIHERNRTKLDVNSLIGQIDLSGQKRETVLYNSKGLYLICAYSHQPKADDFLSFIYDRMQSAIEAASKPPAHRALLLAPTRRERAKIGNISNCLIDAVRSVKSLCGFLEPGCPSEYNQKMVELINQHIYKAESCLNALKRETLSETLASVKLIEEQKIKEIGAVRIDEHEYSKIERERDMYGVYTSAWADGFFCSRKEAQRFIVDNGFDQNKVLRPRIKSVDLIVLERKEHQP